MARWLKALSKTRDVFSGVINKLTGRKGPLSEDDLEELEEALLGADVSVRLVQEVLARLKREVRGADDSAQDKLKESLTAALTDDRSFVWKKGGDPTCVLIVGINGAGKTTTCAKLANMAKAHGLEPVLGAGDTFRAAGTDQLRIWSERVGCDVVSGQQGSDSAAVAYDALDATIARKKDILLLDTAGRMHTKAPLMKELEKIRRSLSKRIEGAPHETWIVLDGSNGQNAISQARYFHDVVPLTGIIITKLDGSSKAGFLFSVKQELGVPVLFVGLGEQEEDLVPFDPEAFVDGLFPVLEAG